MTDPIHVLYVDDSPLDRQLVRDTLERENTRFVLTEADSREEFEQRLNEGGYDVVLSDFNILGYEGLQVIEAVRAKTPDIPVVLFTGTGSEEIAVEAMKKGASDYVIKSASHVKRLPLTIEAVLKNKRLEIQHARDQRRLKESEEIFRSLFENSLDAILLTAPDGRIFKANPHACKMLGYTEQEIVESGRDGVVDTTDPRLSRLLEERRRTGKAIGELCFRRKDGSIFLAEIASSVFLNASGEQRTNLNIRDISKIRALEQERDKLFELLIDMLCIVSFQGYFKQVNPAWTKTLGWSPEELLDKQWTDLVHPEDLESTDKVKSLLREGKAVCDFENRYLCKNGTYKWISWNSISVPYDNSIFAVGRDVTEQKDWETKLLRSEQKYRTIFEHAPVGIYHFDENGVITTCNEVFVSIIGSSKEQLIGLNTITGIKNAEVIESVKKALSSGFGIYEGDYASVTAEKVTPVKVYFRGLRGTDGLVSGGMAIVEDLTERKRSEDALTQSEAKYRLVVENASDGIMVAQDDLIRFANSRAAEMVGYEKKNLIGKIFAEFVDPLDRDIVADRHRRRLLGEEITTRYSIRLLRQNGKARWHEIATGLIDWDGEPAVLVLITDVHDRRREEEARLRLSTAVEQAAEAVVITDSKGKVQYVNPAFESITGYSGAEAVGATAQLWEAPESGPGGLYARIRTITGGKVWKGRIDGKKKDGRLFIEEATISPVLGPNGKIVNYVGVTRDVTGEILLQKQLVQAQKMESIGTLAGGIAHDFNNLLQVILGYSEILLMEKEAGKKDFQELNAINHAAKRGAELVRQILTFSRKMETNLRPINLNQQLKEAQKLLRRTIPRMINIEMALSEDLGSVHADPGQIEQALLNLAVNARDAMPDGGKLTITTQKAILDEEYCQTQVDIKPGEYVVLQVSDTGHGMEKDVVEHIFEPFYTTKQPGEGTGLGLAMVYGIVKGHGGHITCYTEPGLGTTFSIYLPIILPEPAPEIDDTCALPPAGCETLLLVDDDKQIRDFGERVLTLSGYIVLTAANGREALEVYAKSRNEISLLILDLNMPLMGGKECLQELLKIDPDVRAIIASGFYVDGPTKQIIEAGAKGFVQKPFDSKQLLETVRKALDEC